MKLRRASSSACPAALFAALLAVGCGHKSSGAPSGQAAASSRPAGSAASAASAATLDAVAPAGTAPKVSDFVGARSLKACKERTVEIASYQQRGEISLGGQKGAIAAAWMVHIAGKHDEQVAFSSLDGEGKPLGRARGVGFSATGPRVFGTGLWTVAWFDPKGLAYAQPHADPLPPPDIAHLGAIGPELQEDVALTASSGALMAAAPFGADKAQLGLFVFAPDDTSQPAVKAIGVTHHGNQPRHPAVAANAQGTFIAWQEPDGRLAASHFDPAGKETDAACTIAPAGARKRERLSLVIAGAGVMAMWMEEGAIQTRALDKAGCPASPVWTIAEGRWAQIAAVGEGVVVVWVASDGRYLAAKLAADGAPPARGLDVAEGSSGVKDPPAVAGMDGRVAFGWAEVMSSTISTKRLLVRILNSECLP